MLSPFFGPEIGEDQKKGLRSKSSGFLVQNQVKTKKKALRRKITGFSVQMRLETKQNEKTRSSPQISGVMISHHNMVSPQMVSPRAGRSTAPLATTLAGALLPLGPGPPSGHS